MAGKKASDVFSRYVAVDFAGMRMDVRMLLLSVVCQCLQVSATLKLVRCDKYVFTES